ncbi:MAG TPA: thiamine pyrophosphate-dependent enzyme [Candidatus Dormibacteraeota bacterium]
MTTTASDLLFDRLIDWGVDTIFGLPGDGINGLMESLRKREKQIRFIHVRHEEAAAFMACGYAKYTGRLGVCLATSGPGAIHLLNGLYDAALDRVPVLAITGMTYHDLIGTHYQQDVNSDYLFENVALFNQRVMGPAHVENLVDLAVRTAVGNKSVSHITFPNDLQDADAKKPERSEMNVKGHSSDQPLQLSRIPVAADLHRAAAAFQGKKKIAILAGNGARGARAELLEAAEKLGAPIIKPLLGKDVVPDTSPYTTGGIGFLGTRPSEEALEECDALLMVGTSFPYISFLPKPGQATVVQIDDDPSRLGLRAPVTVGLAGDAAPTLRELLPLLPRNADRAFLEKAQAGMRDWWTLMEERGARSETPMKPEVVSENLDQLLTDDAIISTDSGTITTWAARHIRIRDNQRFSLSGNLATMANGLPYTIAAQVAFPKRQCIAFVGDGGFSMLMAEMSTAVKYKLPIKVIVIKNNTLGQIKWEQLVFLGNPEYGVTLQPIDHVKLAESVGAKGIKIDDPAQCREQLAQALAMEGPVVIECVVDPYEPPMPAKIKPKQAKNLAESLARGEAHRGKIATTIFRDETNELTFEESPAGVVARVADKLGSVVPGNGSQHD